MESSIKDSIIKLAEARKIVDEEETTIMLWLDEQVKNKHLSMDAITSYFKYTTKTGGYDAEAYIKNIKDGLYTEV